MSTRDSAPIGSPCWADLWTSDVEGSRRFYGELFGWEAQEPSPEFGGYFMFTRDGVPVAGGMGDMGDMPANDTWKIYLATDDITKTVEAAEAAGAQIVSPPMAGGRPRRSRRCSSTRPARSSAPGSPGRSRVHGVERARVHRAGSSCTPATTPRAVDFYRSVFHWDTDTVGDSDEFRYTTMRDPSGDGELAGIMDASGLPPRRRAGPLVDLLGGRRRRRGGGQGRRRSAARWCMDATDTPYGRLATVADPAGAQFKLRTPNR